MTIFHSKTFKTFLFFLIIFQIIHSSALQAKPPKDVVLRSRSQAGMFSVFFDVLSLLQEYEKKRFNSIEVNFGDTGLYYSKKKGPNWWSYYFAPIKLGIASGPRLNVCGLQYNIEPSTIEFLTPRQEVGRLIRDYVTIKPEIREAVESFYRNHFDGHYVIGIHYRGTDKSIGQAREARRVAYDEVVAKLDEVIAIYRHYDYVIFIATDEWNFIEYISDLFPHRVCYVEEATRSFNHRPVHLNKNRDPYLVGREALIDCLLLSKCDLLIRTSSNLSLASTFFNPLLPVIELSKRNPF